MRRCILLFAVVLIGFTNVPASLAQKARAAQPASSRATLFVDASEAPRKIFHARLTLDVSPGPLTLVYPKWIPGEHGPTGPIADLAGLKFTAGGRAVPWRRDLVEMYAINLDVPPGATSLEATLDFLSPANAQGFSSAASA